ncbi:MAG: hypothetical protein WCD86_06105 [Ktedonobacteraceae bacterium]
MNEMQRESSSPLNMRLSHFSSLPPTPIFRTIEGALPGGKRLAEPLAVRIEYDEGEYLVSETRYYIHAGDPTLEEAIAEFKRVLSDELDALTSDEEKLGPRLRAQLHYLRSIIKAA